MELKESHTSFFIVVGIIVLETHKYSNCCFQPDASHADLHNWGHILRQRREFPSWQMHLKHLGEVLRRRAKIHLNPYRASPRQFGHAPAVPRTNHKHNQSRPPYRPVSLPSAEEFEQLQADWLPVLLLFQTRIAMKDLDV